MTTANIYPYLLTTLLRSPQKLLLIDIRSKQEYDAGHLVTACNISISQKKDVQKLEKYITSSKESVIYCNEGLMSMYVAKLLHKHGVSTHVLVGGLENYVNSMKNVKGLISRENKVYLD
jgi:rhodanese-related sulfurtransferase